jgi:site-specific DNA-cytosine methylase
MQHWLAKIAHQSKASESLFAFENVKQMTMHQYLATIWKTNLDQCKYLP